jgi:hypothetical protein
MKIFIKKKLELLNKSNIFINNINNKYKLVPFKIKENIVGKTKYFPAESKEWKNKVYFYNYNQMINFPFYDININKLIKSYFTMYFRNKIIKKKYLSPTQKRLSLNKVYVSKPEIKHTNNKAIITIYVYDRENLILLNNVKKNNTNFLLSYLKITFKKLNIVFKKSLNIKSIICLQDINTYYSYHINIVKYLFKKELKLLRKYKLKFNINKYKFKDIFLYKLSNMIRKLYKKEIEFNIINLQSIILNPDIFTEILKLNLRKRGKNVLKAMNFILNKIKVQVEIPELNIIKERIRIKNIDHNLLENKYKNLNLNSIININNNLDITLKGLYTKICDYKKFIFEGTNKSINTRPYNKNIENNVIFNSIKYKNIGGIKLEVKGRLTKRYRAEKSKHNIKWKGALKNSDSSFKGLSAVNFRGYAYSNIEYSISTSKRRIGAFAIKGWVSGK